MTFSREEFGSDYANFNVDAANDVYQWYMDTDTDEANMILNMFMSEVVSKAMEEYGDEILETVQKNVNERLNLLKRTVANSVVSKSMSDGAVDAAVNAVELVSKATTYTTWERRQNVARQRRGPGGRFAPMGKTTLNNATAQDATQGHPTWQENQNNPEQIVTLASPNGLRNLGQYQQAYDEISSALSQLAPSADRPIWGEITAQRGNQEVKRRVRLTGNQPGQVVTPIDFFGSNEVKDVTWYPDGNESPESAGYIDPVAAVGTGLAGYGQRNVMNAPYPGESGATRGMRHVGNVATTAEEMGMDVGIKSKAAIAAGKMVGDFGPEAEKVFGPGMRRAAYRYRGTERDIDPEMFQAIGDSIKGSESPNDARDNMMIPRINTVREFGRDVEVAEPSRFLRYWQNRLPDVQLIDLHTNSGAIAPSEGTVFDRAGKPVTQAVGYGDDHYLPFNLRKLSKAKGGEYIRTRTVGGPTTEDIYAGLMSGTRAMTVVSHSGIFTVEFDPAFRGSRRLNDKAGRMQARYGKLLDTLAAEKVQLNAIPKDRSYELREQVNAEIPGESKEVLTERDARFQELMAAEIKNPQPSAAKLQEWSDEYIEDKGQEFTDTSGEPLGADQLKAEYGISTGQQITSNEQLINAMGANEDYQRFIESKRREYASDLRPLKLNGQGYYNALKALKEQFPYYISNVRWTPPDEDSVGLRDKGYVKARHLRSDNVLEGYWDSSIEGYRDTNPKSKLYQSGKRQASGENYVNAAARERDRGYRRFENDEIERRNEEERVRNAPPPDAETPSEGGGAPAATPATRNPAASGRVTRFASGAYVSTGGNGAIYGGFRQMRVPPAEANLTEYQANQQIARLRTALKNLEDVTYTKTTGGTARFKPWDDNENNPLQRFGALMSRVDDDEFIDRLTTDPNFRSRALQDARGLYEAGQGSSRGIEPAVLSALSGRNVFNGIVGDLGVPQHPRSSASLIAGLTSNSSRQYDFSAGRMDGSSYLPGLTQTDYVQAWNADNDIQLFTNSSEKRFGYRLGFTQDKNVFNGLVRQFATTMERGNNKAQQFRSDIQRYGGASRIPKHEIVKYGDKDYSAFNVNELEADIARDALALAKMKQLRRNHDQVPFTTSTDKIQLVELLSDEEKLTREREFGPEVGDLRFAQHSETSSAPSSVNEPKLAAVRNRLDSFVGLESVKEEFNGLVNEAKINQRRKELGLPYTQPTMHLIFNGNPGTGKTTVAEELGKAYNALGILPTDKTNKYTRADLVGSYAGQTAPKVRQAFDESKGGVLFIDEAYGLVTGDSDQFGFEAIDELVSLAEERRGDTVVILAGYPDEMERLMTSNPGLRSRFPKTIDFPDYSSDELAEITRRHGDTERFVYSPEAKKAMASTMQRIAGQRHFSNARDSRNWENTLRRTQAARIMREHGAHASKQNLIEITDDDVANADRIYFQQRTGNQ